MTLVICPNCKEEVRMFPVRGRGYPLMRCPSCGSTFNKEQVDNMHGDG